MTTAGPQGRFWQVTARYGTALLASDEPLADGDPRVLELDAARDALAAFCRDHRGEVFSAFNPAHIRAAFRDDVEGWEL